jgi:hypothetical protein
MSQALYVTLMNALAVCLNHQPDLHKAVWDRGFEQCAVIEPAAQKAEADHYAPIKEAQERADKADLEKAVAALKELDEQAKRTAAKGNNLLPAQQ